ncbi:MAG: PAS domain S-box protein [Burkholderiaceae bacterium]
MATKQITRSAAEGGGEARLHQIELAIQNDGLQRAQAELEAQRSLYFDLFDRAPVGYCTVSANGLIVAANQAAATLLGVSQCALPGQPMLAFIADEDAAVYAELIGRPGETASSELRIRKPGGAPGWTLMAVSAMLDATGAPMRRVVLNDIDAQKQVQRGIGAGSRAQRALELSRVLLGLREVDIADSGAFVRAATQAAARALGAARVSVWRVQGDGEFLQCLSRFRASDSVHEPGERLDCTSFPRHLAALDAGDVIAADECLIDPRSSEFAPWWGTLGVTSMLDAPLRIGGRLAGALCVEHIGAPRHWTDEEQDFVRELSSVVLHAITQAEHLNALARTERQLRTLLDGMPERAWLKDAQGRFLALNRSEASVLDLPMQAVVGKTLKELRPGVAAEQDALEDELAMRAPGPTRLEREARFGRGWLEIVRAPIRGADGRVEGLVGIGRDATERRRTERALAQSAAALEQSTRRFEEALSAANTFVFELHLPDSRVTLHGAPRFGGPGSVAELGLQDASSNVVPEDAAELARQFERIRDGAVADFSIEYRVRQGDGSLTWRHMQARIVARDNPANRPLRATGTSTDITARKQAELALAALNRELEVRIERRTEALAESEARFRAVMRDAPVGILVIAKDRRIIDANQRICEVLGYPKATLVGMSIRDITYFEDWPANAALATPMEAGELQNFALEKRYVCSDGGIVWARLSVAAVSDAMGRHLYRISVIEDITERRQAEARLQQYAAQVSALSGRLLRAQEDERHRVARELHDEVGQVLTAVQMALATVDRQAGGESRHSPLATAKGLVGNAIVRLRTLWHELRSPVLDELGLSAALHGLCTQHERLSQMTVNLDIACDPRTFSRHLTEAVYRVCQEALTNAARHSQASCVEVSLGRCADTVTLQVRDDGVGFDATLTGSTDRLGLVGMRERVKLLGGVLQVDSAPGAGTLIRAEIAAALGAP